MTNIGRIRVDIYQYMRHLSQIAFTPSANDPKRLGSDKCPKGPHKSWPRDSEEEVETKCLTYGRTAISEGPFKLYWGFAPGELNALCYCA